MSAKWPYAPARHVVAQGASIFVLDCGHVISSSRGVLIAQCDACAVGCDEVIRQYKLERKDVPR